MYHVHNIQLLTSESINMQNLINYIFDINIDAPPRLNVRASPQAERGKVEVSWTPPTPPPGSSLTGYSIQYRMRGSRSYMTAGDPGRSATSTIVSNLQVGTQYQVRVAAKTELGVGPNSYARIQVTTFNGVFTWQYSCAIYILSILPFHIQWLQFLRVYQLSLHHQKVL